MKDNPTARRVLVKPDHPLATGRGLVGEHRVVLYDTIGPGPHPCHWCGRELHWVVGGTSGSGIVVDHVDNDPHNNSPTNLVPSCQGCNGTRWHWIRDDEVVYVQSDGRRRRGIERICATCGNSFVISAGKPDPRKKRPGRYCSLECLWNRNH